MKDQRGAERISCLCFPAAASYKLVLVMYPRWELCKFGVGGEGGGLPALWQ